MIIQDIKITNFKSLYGSHFFDFTKLDGLIKLSGPIGSGKTSLAEAILYGLYGTVKGQNNTNLIAWNTKACEVEMHLISKNKNVYIKRNIHEPLIVEINGRTLSASNKKNTQSILEEEIFDVIKLLEETSTSSSIYLTEISNDFNKLNKIFSQEIKDYAEKACAL